MLFHALSCNEIGYINLFLSQIILLYTNFSIIYYRILLQNTMCWGLCCWHHSNTPASVCAPTMTLPESSYRDRMSLQTKNILVHLIHTRMSGTDIFIIERQCYEQQSLSVSWYFSHWEFWPSSSSSARSGILHFLLWTVFRLYHPFSPEHSLQRSALTTGSGHNGVGRKWGKSWGA